MNSRKKQIEQSFGDKVGSYSRYAALQKESAQKLAGFLPESAPAKILEIGCGTGFLTEELQHRYPNANILASDISKDMVTSCRQKFTGYRNIDFAIFDGENFDSTEKFDLIVSNLTVQWFDNPITGLQKLCQNLTPSGVLYFTTIGAKSFWQWQETLKNLNLSSGMLNAPEYDGIFEAQEKIIAYKNALDFLQNLKKIGAHQPRDGHTPLSAGDLQKACKAFNSAHQGRMTWEVLYGALDASGRAFHKKR